MGRVHIWSCVCCQDDVKDNWEDSDKENDDVSRVTIV